MNIAQTANETTEVISSSKTTTTKIYINMYFAQLASDINSGLLAHQFNGKGRKITPIPENQESNYLYYSSDKAGETHIEPPFEINNGDNIKFKLQTAPTDESDTSYKWQGILQNRFDLQLVSEKKRSANYKAVATESTAGAPPSEADDVIIHIDFKNNGDKFSATWDPVIRIKR
ncbi:MAG: hypothetical protein HRT52_16920 [Colwellia sp.]|nr:hypothetical protein [Colwellia sp.]